MFAKLLEIGKDDANEDLFCPYRLPGSGTKRRAWMTGWLDARTVYRLGEIFERHAMVYP